MKRLLALITLGFFLAAAGCDSSGGGDGDETEGPATTVTPGNGSGTFAVDGGASNTLAAGWVEASTAADDSPTFDIYLYSAVPNASAAMDFVEITLPRSASELPAGTYSASAGTVSDATIAVDYVASTMAYAFLGTADTGNPTDSTVTVSKNGADYTIGFSIMAEPAAGGAAVAVTGSYTGALPHYSDE